MFGLRGTLAQRGSFWLGVFFVVTGIIGLLVNPDFGTGSELNSRLFIVDWNGWHAVATLLLAATAFVAATRRPLAVAFLGVSAVANANTAVWAMFDNTPLGVLDLPNVATDVVLHFVVTAVSLILFFAQLAHDRAVGYRPADG